MSSRGRSGYRRTTPRRARPRRTPTSLSESAILPSQPHADAIVTTQAGLNLSWKNSLARENARLERPARRGRQQCRLDHLRSGALAAESASDAGRDDADVVLLYPQALRAQVGSRKGGLRRGPDDLERNRLPVQGEADHVRTLA